MIVQRQLQNPADCNVVLLECFYSAARQSVALTGDGMQCQSRSLQACEGTPMCLPLPQWGILQGHQCCSPFPAGQ